MGYGIKKLQINAVIEDDKVSTDDLEEQIVGFEDFVSPFYAPSLINKLFLSQIHQSYAPYQKRQFCFFLKKNHQSFASF